MALGDYFPKPPTEKHHYDYLWLHVSPDGTDISGRKAVEFLRLSGVDSGILKQIWGLSTPVSTMNQMQFNSALRYITMVQNGEIPISKGKKSFLIRNVENSFCMHSLLSMRVRTPDATYHTVE
jgi:hypothetical protein